MTKHKIVIGVLVIFVVVMFWWSKKPLEMLSPGNVVTEKPYDKYSFENLAKRGGVASRIEIVGDKFYYQSEGRRISGQIHEVDGEVKGIIVMARGYVDKEIYQTGVGTKNAAAYYASQGYLTYAPDFSGYGESDPDPTSPPASLGARVIKPVQILDLIASLPQDKPIFLWGHSNGGQIMISVAEIIGSDTVPRDTKHNIHGVILWAPVSKPFPYNILYYTDDASDSGKWLRSQVAAFEKDYDVFNYSVDKYLDWISIPVQIHQGASDEAVPRQWSDNLVKTLKEKGKAITYYTYPGADHNMHPSWDAVVARDVQWFDGLRTE